MRRLVRTLLLLLLAVPVLYLSLGFSLSYYDRSTRHRVLQMAAAELPPHASMGQMKQFLGRHTTGFGFDKYNSELGGFLPQSRVDKALFDRKVGIDLEVDDKTQTLRDADVEISYTFL